MRVLPYGESALLAETDAPLALQAAAASLPEVTGTVPGAQTLLLRFDPARTDGARLASALEALDVGAATGPAGSLIKLDVRYDGGDLAAVVEQTGLSVAELITRHSGAEYTVAFCGFSPGFAYLTGLDPVLHLPRLATPRISVPAGSVAVAGEFTGVYPRSSPGGWRLLGTTDAVLWDATRPDPALLRPGTRVRFRPS